MSNKYDIKSKNVVIGTQAGVTSFGIGVVPAGKTRFITLIRATNIYHGVGATNTLYLASNAASAVTTLATATAAKKLTMPFDATIAENIRQVGRPDVDQPLFTIDASHYLIGCASRKPIDTFVQYYDD